MKKHILSLTITFATLLWQQPSWAEDLPGWYDKEARLEEVRRYAVSKGMDSKVQLRLHKYDMNFQSLAGHKLTSITTIFQSEKGDHMYRISELFTEPPKKPKVLSKVIEKADCSARQLKEMGLEELDSFEGMKLVKLQLILEPPSCDDSEKSRPEVVMIVQDKKSGLEKLYESPILKNGHQLVKIEKNGATIELTADTPTFIHLVWSKGSKKFIEKKN